MVCGDLSVKSETARLPAGHSYVLAASLLDEKLTAAGLRIDTHLIRSPGGILLDAHFWPPNQNVPHERLYVRAGTVPRPEAADARRFIAEEALPNLIRWLADILSQDVASPVRREEQYWRATLP